MIARLLLEALTIGSIVAIGSLGLTLQYGSTRFINFAYGDFVLMGIYCFLGFSFFMNNYLALILGMAGAGVLGLVITTIVFRPIRDQGPVTLLITSLGLGFVLRYAMSMIVGSFPRTSPVKEINLSIAGGVVSHMDIMAILVAIITFILLLYLLYSTNMGAKIRALSSNRELAKIRGVNIERTLMFIWFLTFSLATLCGFFFFSLMPLSPTSGWHIMAYFFAAVLVGGIGRPKGAILGGYIVGFAVVTLTYFFSPAYEMAYMYGALIIAVFAGGGGIFRGLV